jgi:hypothetical protein
MDIVSFESQWADEIKDPSLQKKVDSEYQKRWPAPIQTPDTHPWKYDPFHPPAGWRYDAYYEIWIKL